MIIIITILVSLITLKHNVIAQNSDVTQRISPISITLQQPNFATMINKQHNGNRIGYRFHEHKPISYGRVPLSNEKANINIERVEALEESYKRSKDVFIYEHKIEKDEFWLNQDWTYYLKPVHDGVEMLLIINTYDEGLPEYYGVQQCFRMSGKTNEEWRKKIANTPAFSEYDLWNSQSTGTDKKSLTYVLRDNEWQAIPVSEKSTGARTPIGVAIDDLRTNGQPMSEVGPYKAKMLNPIDNGLITRINLSESWVCGIHWQNTSHVTDHHPADCLHAIINIGNIPPFSKKAILGKIYWFEGNKDSLYYHYKKDFMEETIQNGCGENRTVPTYLNDYEKEYIENPKEANLKWFTNAKYGMFIHYGLYSLLEKGEWVQLKDTIPVAEYARLKDQFTAKNFNAGEITQLAIEAGMKYITITSKHHDGFCLFNTKATNFNALESPAKRDLIKELYEACEKKGLGLFLYYSYGADWKHPYFYSRESGWSNARPAYTVIQPEYKFEKDEDFNIYIDYVHEQLKEIFTLYPNIAGIWFDPIMGYYNRPDLFPIDSTYALIRKMSPHALISFKQGANGDEDFMAPERGGNAKVGQQFEVAKIAYNKNQHKPREICNTLQPHAWGYNKEHDGNHKTVDDIIKMLNDAEELNANLLLNIGPKGDGSIPEEDIETLQKAGKHLKEKKHCHR